MNTTSTNIKNIVALFTAAIALLGASTKIQAASYTGSASGAWASTTTWGGSGPPVAGDTVTINSGVTVTVLASAACTTLTVNGTLAVSNTFAVSGNTEFTSTGSHARVGTSGSETYTGNVQLDSGSSWTEASAASSGLSFGGNFINNATTFTTSSATHTFTGTAMSFSGSTTSAFTTASISGSYTNNGTVSVSGTLTLGGTLANNGTFSFGGSGGSGTLTQGAGASLTDTQSNGGAPNFTITATAAGNTVSYSGSGPAVKATSYQNLTFSYASSGSSFSWPSSGISVAGTLTAGGGSSGTSLNNVNGTFGAIVENGGNITANNAITVNTNLTVTSGTFYAQTGLLSVSGTTTINGGTLELGGSGAAFTGDFSLSTGTFNSSFSGQNPAVGFSGNLTVSGGTFTAGTGVNTFSGSSKTINGTISMPKVTVNGTYANTGTLTVSTALAGSGTLTQNANSALNLGGTSASLTLAASANTPNTVSYTSTSAQSVLSDTYNNLTVSGASTKTLGGAVTVNGTLTISAGTLADGGFTLTANAGVVNNGTHSGAGKISLTGGSASHSLSGTGAYGNLQLNDANGASIASGTSTVNGTLTLTSGQLSSGGGALSLANGSTVARAAGSLTLTPTFTTSVNVIYNDVSPTTTGSEVPASATILSNLTINNAAGVTLNAGATLKGTLTLTSGLLATGANTLTVTSAGTVSGGSSSSYVYGKLDRGLATGSGKSAAFPVGDSSVYAPVSLASATVTGAGDLVVSTVNNENSQGAFSSSGLSQIKYVNRDWTIAAANGYAESAGSITLNFVPGDVQGSMSTTADYVSKYSGSAWTKPTVASRTSTSITLSGITSFSDWVIGELPVPVFSGLNSPMITYGASSLMLSGKLSANSGTVFPVSGSAVTASINGHAVNGLVTDGTGDFAITYNNSSLATDGVGSSPYTITYSFAGDANVAAAVNDMSTALTVSQAALTITANNKIKTYGDTVTLTGATDFTANGLQNGETVGSVILTASGGTAATDPVSGSPYTITPSAATGGTFNPNNYATITYDTGTLTVNPLAVNLTGSRPYDGTTNAPAAILSVANAVGGDNVTVASGTAGLAGKSVPAETITSFGGLALGNNAAGDYTLTGASGSVTISALGTSVSSGLAANDKVYDGTNTTTISITNTVVLAGAINGDVVTLDTNGYSATFAGVDAGTNLVVTVSGLTLDGTDASNYSLAQPSGLTADILPAPVTVTGIVASDKVYDGTTNVIFDVSEAALAGVLGSDTNNLTLETNGVTAAFADPNVGTDKPVTVYGMTLSGSATNDYTLTQPMTTASITPAPLTVNGVVAIDKYYDQTTVATIDASGASLAGVVMGDDATLDTNGYSAMFDSAGAGMNIPVTVSGLTLDGTTASNYSLAMPLGLTANINPAPVTANVTVSDKYYDGTPAATITGESLTGVINGDDASLAAGASASFSDKNAGTGKLVTVTGLSLTGVTAPDYMLASSTVTTNADIAALPITVTAASNTKDYDGTTSAAALPTVTSGTVQVGDTAAFVEAYTDPTVGTGKTLVASGIVSDGNDGNNYTYTFVNDPTGVINLATPALGLVSSQNPADVTVGVGFTATVSGAADVPTGTVQFTTNGVSFGDPVALDSGSATSSVTNFARGTNLVAAIYSGDANYAPVTNTLEQVSTNLPPVAATTTVLAAAGAPLDIVISNLATNWSDPDGDTVTLAGVNPSTNGVILTTNATDIFYPTNVTGSDQFTYTITDGQGGTNTGIVNIEVDPSTVTGAVDSISVTGSTPTVNFTGIPGFSYSVQVSTNLTDWTTVLTTNAPDGGSFQFSDPAPPQPAGFYRLTWTP